MDQRLLTQTVIWQGTSYKGLHASDDNSLSLYESLCPAGSGPPRHVHAREDETFYILDGTVDFWIAGNLRTCGPGDVVHVTRGTEHTFRIGPDAPGRMLTVLTPGGFEGFFVEMASRNCSIPADMPLVVKIAAEFNLAFTGPPL